jgi:ComF family protein
MINHLARIDFDLSGYDFIVGVPSHTLRIKEREYSQTLLLAQALADHLKIPLRDTALQCIKYHPSQTKVSPQLRTHNIEGAFTVNQKIEGKNVLLIDDVITTGATVSECSKILKKAGAKTVSILSLARAG